MEIQKGNTANVQLWDTGVGTIAWDEAQQLGHFTYSAKFLEERVQVAPIKLPLNRGRFAFPDLNTNVFKGLPGVLADSLPDKFGTAVIDAWLAQQDLPANALNPVERLRLIGSRGMGALEYAPPLAALATPPDGPLDLSGLIDVINCILSGTSSRAALSDQRMQDALTTLMHIGISADGARAKAVVGWQPGSPDVYMGHEALPTGCGYWLLKFDGITGNRDRESASDPQGWGIIEYAYHLMARAAGIAMSDCRLLNDNGRQHFITRRFDRTDDGAKLHRQSLCAMGHMDFDALGSYSYEQVVDIMRELELPQAQVEEFFRRMVFNVLARNHDDHAKNVAFLMSREGRWSLAPAYDLTFAYNPEGQWTHCHQMTLNGKRDHFTYDDFETVATTFDIGRERCHALVQQVAHAVSQWTRFADQAGVSAEQADAIAKDLRLHIV